MKFFPNSLAKKSIKRFPVCVTFLTAIILSACAPKDTSYDAIVQESIPKIESQSGLKFKTPPKVESRSRDQVRAFLLATLEDSTTMHELRGTEVAYKLFGMIRDTLSMEKLLVDLLGEQVVGYYDPNTKVLYVVEGANPDMVRGTIAHELVHALQDQYVNLDSIQKLKGNSDRSMAAQSIFEGQAMYEQLVASKVPLSIPGAWDRILKSARQDQAGMPVFASAPFAIQEALLFPYINGAQFFQRYKQHADSTGGLNYRDLPVSTEQILHPTKFFDERDDPVTVNFGPIAGVTPIFDDNLGEFGIRVLLFDRLRIAEAIRAASGGDGDRYMVFSHNGQNALAWATVWDSDLDVRLFENIMNRYIGMMQSAKRDKRVRQLTIGEVSGRWTSLYVDLPEGSDVGMIPMSAVQITE